MKKVLVIRDPNLARINEFKTDDFLLLKEDVGWNWSYNSEHHFFLIHVKTFEASVGDHCNTSDTLCVRPTVLNFG